MSISTRSTTAPHLQAFPEPPAPRRSGLRAILPLPAGKALGVLLLAILTLLTAVILIELPVWRHAHGNILFPLDNAYFNITVARNLAFYQVWGISKYAFQSAASSLLYPITLAPIFFIFGAHLVIPLIVNFLAGAYFLLMLQRTLIRYGVPPARQLLVLIGTMALTLLPLLVAGGTEYTLQLLFVFLFMDAVVQTLAAPAAPKAPTGQAPSAPHRPLYIFALLAVAARYEDLLIIALAALPLGLQKGWKPAAKLTAISITPIIVFGVISMLKKSYFLPNSMLVGPYPTYTLILALIAAAAAIAAAWLIIRYRALTPILLLLVPFTARNAVNLAHFEKHCDHTYDEQYLTAHFVHLYYYRQTVGTNQPGALSYFSEGRKLDYTGVATPLCADSLSKKDGIRVAIVADPWFRACQLPKWTRIATWDITEGSPDSPDIVNFYAVEAYDTTWLRRRLHEFQPLLPSTVSVRYY